MENNPLTQTAGLTQELPGRTSPESAYLVEDYPYGFRLRCKIRYWLEFKPGHGFRFMSQTTNPKRVIAPLFGPVSEFWNKPKAGTYSLAAALYLDTEGHVHCAGLSEYSNGAELDAFKRLLPQSIAADKHIATTMAWFEKLIALRDERHLAGGRLIP
jgi:hypothetical protein